MKPNFNAVRLKLNVSLINPDKEANRIFTCKYLQIYSFNIYNIDIFLTFIRNPRQGSVGLKEPNYKALSWPNASTARATRPDVKRKIAKEVYFCVKRYARSIGQRDLNNAIFFQAPLNEKYSEWRREVGGAVFKQGGKADFQPAAEVEMDGVAAETALLPHPNKLHSEYWLRDLSQVYDNLPTNERVIAGLPPHNDVSREQANLSCLHSTPNALSKNSPGPNA